MDLVGEFHKVEIDGKTCFKYHNPFPPTHTPNSSSKVAIDSGHNLSDQPLFLCPTVRIAKAGDSSEWKRVDVYHPSYKYFVKLDTSFLSDDDMDGHYLLPLFWCNNKEAGPDSECRPCSIPYVGAGYYLCVKCDRRYHKECVESPIEIKYPSHVKHSLQLYFSYNRSDQYCIYCREKANGILYYCALCDIFMHVWCAQMTIPFFIEQPKRHEHTLTLFPRQASLNCNVCGLVDKVYLTYVCRSICDFVAHSNCINIPQTIRISRHPHRVSFVSSLPFKEASCGVCRQAVGSDYGAYTCNVCCGYAVHTRCALRPDIWDGIELEGVPEEDEDVESFERVGDGVIRHISHRHHLKFEINGAYDANKFCQACVLPIYGGNFYVCVECDFILHETCAEAPLKTFHPLHPHPLKLNVSEDYVCSCVACTRMSSGFFYSCPEKGCFFSLDMRCALVSEPVKYQGHQHPIFLALDPKEKPICHVCKSTGDQKILNCIECEFIICFKCATLPYMARYKHDEHYLTFCHANEIGDSDWCESCERKLTIGGKEGFYRCNDYCCTTLHIDCLFGEEPYLQFGKYGWLQILRNDSPSRPVCIKCNIRCPYPIFFQYQKVVSCTYKCIMGMK